ncbi:LolA family protein [Celeribacter indicus]|uniref:Outer membrane lipoprotein carrier protein LolA n=1 Tax=Celeribacter indicus TaxID=1208324 RepID=A0A0B5DPQ5_9RHOB|nr:outer membrane lipoprotein carrier protein LolA [Celeribacter indicus]AJE45134.1 outer membrane lipoprotein carrier protein LolA [Celeribacter indicus]SDX26680.1 Outer membrane lipoprotein-sorting protein [Celeribacter indicus]
MKRFLTALAPAVLFALSTVAPAVAEKLPLSTLSAYLNGLSTVQAEFVQTNDDGSRSNGTVTIKRPGRIRLEYGGPGDPLVLGMGGQVAVFDPGSNEPPQRFPMSQTPLNVILARNIDLTRAKMVVSHTERNGDTIVRAQDPDHPEYGYIDLIFSNTPVLKAWIVHDESGATTEVQLQRMSLGGSVSDGVFNIRSEARRRGTPLD